MTAGRASYHLHSRDLALSQGNDLRDAGLVTTQSDDVDLRGKLVAAADEKLRDAGKTRRRRDGGEPGEWG